MRYPLATDLKTRTGVPDKDARMKNSYIETKGEQQIIRKRPGAQGGVATGSGVAQGGIGIVVNGVSTIVTVWGDTPVTDTDPGGWTNGSTYADGGSGPDTQLWTIGSRQEGYGNSPSQIAWNGSVYVYISTNISTGYMQPVTSSDGITWTAHSDILLSSSANEYGIAWNGTVFCIICATGGSGLIFSATSTNGTSWTVHSMAYGGGTEYFDIASNGSIFCCVGYPGEAITSSDGITWTAHTIGDSQYAGITWNGSVFCIVGKFTSDNRYATSADGISWTTGTLPNSNRWLTIKSKGSTICIGGYTRSIASSDNGSTWTQSSAVLPITGLAANSSIFIAVHGGSSSTSYDTSTDGITWTTQDLFPLTKAWNIAYYGNSFIVFDLTTVSVMSTTGL